MAASCSKQKGCNFQGYEKHFEMGQKCVQYVLTHKGRLQPFLKQFLLNSLVVLYSSFSEVTELSAPNMSENTWKKSPKKISALQQRLFAILFTLFIMTGNQNHNQRLPQCWW